MVSPYDDPVEVQSIKSQTAEWGVFGSDERFGIAVSLYSTDDESKSYISYVSSEDAREYNLFPRYGYFHIDLHISKKQYDEIKSAYLSGMIDSLSLSMKISPPWFWFENSEPWDDRGGKVKYIDDESKIEGIDGLFDGWLNVPDRYNFESHSYDYTLSYVLKPPSMKSDDVNYITKLVEEKIDDIKSFQRQNYLEMAEVVGGLASQFGKVSSRNNLYLLMILVAVVVAAIFH